MGLFAVAALIVADPDGWGHMGGSDWGMAVFGLIFMALLVVLVGWFIWSTSHRNQPPAPAGRRALDVLDERYARGEVDSDEYMKRKADLER